MNVRALRHHVAFVLLLIAATSWLAGCAGAGPAASRGGGRPRCGGSSSDDQRPLFYIFCVESP